MPRVLFITKFREAYDQASGSSYSGGGLSSGLYNSGKFIADMLNENGIEAKVAQVVDNNDIDREVHRYQPTHVFIEALWVVPDKFAVLHALYPDVKWIVRLHSNTPFAATEGIFTEWVGRYLDFPNVYLNCNAHEMFNSLQAMLFDKYEFRRFGGTGYVVDLIERVSWLPNYYPLTERLTKHTRNRWPYVHVGCFGAARPLKNQLIQAIAAIKFADSVDRNLAFHINVGRSDDGNRVLKNLRNLFANQVRHQLVEHPWMEREDFLAVVRTMDIGMQVSFSETFNIVTADMVNQNIPVVVSPQIDWVSPLFWADPTDTNEMVAKLRRAWKRSKYELQALNRLRLQRFNAIAVKLWLNFFA